MKSKPKTKFKQRKRKLQASELRKRLSKIKLLILDVDGVLTDGTVFYVNGSGWTRTFHVHDGYGIRMLVRRGFPVAVISGGSSQDVMERMKVLGVQHVYLGNEDKLNAYAEVLKKTGVRDEEAAFIADELFDLPVLSRVGFSATVPGAVKQVRDSVDYVTARPGGHGAAREIIDLILEAQPKQR